MSIVVIVSQTHFLTGSCHLCYSVLQNPIIVGFYVILVCYSAMSIKLVLVCTGISNTSVTTQTCCDVSTRCWTLCYIICCWWIKQSSCFHLKGLVKATDFHFHCSRGSFVVNKDNLAYLAGKWKVQILGKLNLEFKAKHNCLWRCMVFVSFQVRLRRPGGWGVVRVNEEGLSSSTHKNRCGRLFRQIQWKI